MYDAIVSHKHYGTQYFLHAVICVVTFLTPQFMPKGFLHMYAANFLLLGSHAAVSGRAIHHDQGRNGIDESFQGR